MILLELINWIIEHWGEVTLNAVLLLLLRKFIMAEVHKLLYFNRDEEMQWMRLMIEKLTGEKWSGQQPIYKRVLTLYTKRFTFYSRKAILLENIRRKTKMKLLLNSQWSKKLFAFLLLVIINGLNDVLGLHLSPATIERVTTLGGTYILAQAGVDAIKPILLYVVGLITSMSGGTQNVDTKPTIEPDANK